MARLRFSTAALLVGVAFAAVACAALAQPSFLWVTGIRMLVFVAVLVAAARVAAACVPRAAAAAGFAVWTTLYLVLNADAARFWTFGTQPRLLTMQLTQYLAEKLDLQSPMLLALPRQMFYETAHYVWAAIFGVLGAMTTVYFARKTESHSAPVKPG